MYNKYVKSIKETLKELKYEPKTLYIQGNCIYAIIFKERYNKYEVEGLYAANDSDVYDVFNVYDLLLEEYKFKNNIKSSNTTVSLYFYTFVDVKDLNIIYNEDFLKTMIEYRFKRKTKELIFDESNYICKSKKCLGEIVQELNQEVIYSIYNSYSKNNTEYQCFKLKLSADIHKLKNKLVLKNIKIINIFNNL